MRRQAQGNQKSGVIVCAWCSRYLGTRTDLDGVSHGICVDCKTRELAHWGARSSFGGVHGTHHGGPLFGEIRVRG